PTIHSSSFSLYFSLDHPSLHSFPTRRSSDLVLSLAATAEIPSVVVIAGTGSAVLGRTSPLKVARAGGFGPVIGDTGSANDIGRTDRKSTRLNSSHVSISYAVFCLKKKKKK